MRLWVEGKMIGRVAVQRWRVQRELELCVCVCEKGREDEEEEKYSGWIQEEGNNSLHP